MYDILFIYKNHKLKTKAGLESLIIKGVEIEETPIKMKSIVIVIIYMSSSDKQAIKLVLLGDSFVGRTALIRQFVDHAFPIEYIPTIGINYAATELEIDGKQVKLQIWDIGEREGCKATTSVYYRGTNCCILVYDVSKSSSFENIQKWKITFAKATGLSNTSDFPFFLLGNKIDLPEKAVDSVMAQDFSKKNGCMLFFEVSAKTGENVQESFEQIAQYVLKKIK